MPSERERRSLPADYESFWERRYNEQHRTLHSCEDALKDARERAERAEAALRKIAAHRPYVPEKHANWQRCVDIARDVLASFSGEEGAEG